MQILLAFLRRWLVPAILVSVAAVLTVPWAIWVIHAAYDREIGEKAQMIARLVHVQLSSTRYWTTPQQSLDSMRNDLLSDPAVQAVCVIDESIPTVAHIERDPGTPYPRTVAEVNQFIKPNSNSFRAAPIRQQHGGYRRVIYVDLSKPELNRHFWVAYRELLYKVIAVTAIGAVFISAAGILAYEFWNRAWRQKQRAQLAQQGLLAERVLTAAVLAHEIRNPLAALRFQIHSLRRNASDPGRIASTADTIDGELSRIQQLVQNYLAHERAAAMHVESVDLASAASSLHTLMDELLRQSNTRLIILEPGRSIVVACDPHALRQVLINLIINAQQAMGHGGTISIAVGQEETFGTISVADTGPGIPPEMRERLFKPFATSKKDGSGIGLALVRRFVDNFGGTVSVDSEPGHGATFKLRLPLADLSSPDQETGSQETPVEGSMR